MSAVYALLFGDADDPRGDHIQPESNALNAAARFADASLAASTTADCDLLERMRAGDHAAFETVIRRHYPELRAYALSLVDLSDAADDILQELFLVLWRSHRQLHITHGIRAYLYSSVRNRLQNYTRGERRQLAFRERYQREVASPDESSAGARNTDEQQLLDTEAMIAAVHSAIEQLPTRAREAWYLHHDRGLTYAEVASVMGISIGTVKSQMARAVGLIRAIVSRASGFPPSRE